MADIIQLLPDAIANQIAAGEVIQRPASVVKELMENSVDAGSSSVHLLVKDAGKSLLQVTDDGCGMSETDARMCFERHATSKIRSADDLFAIRTMGFRGEAMASIAAVAQVELRTRRQADELGVRLLMEASVLKKQEPWQCPAGTTIAVKNLFFNVPARRKFLKSDPVEMRHIIDEFQRVALAHPDVHFSLTHNDAELFHLPPGKLRQRVVGILGAQANPKLVPLGEDTDVLKITGFIGKPEFAKKTRGEQFFFINGRFIKSAFLHHAVMAAYDDLLKDAHPMYVIYMEMDPSRIDVNVHPTKQEIKFDDERIVYNYLKVTVRHALGRHNITPSLDFEREPGLSEFRTAAHAPRQEEEDEEAQVLPSRMNQPDSARHQSNLRHWEKLYEGLSKDFGTATASPDEAEPDPLGSDEDGGIILSSANWDEGEDEDSPPDAPRLDDSPSRPPYQIHNTYIVSQIMSGFLLIDQQAAQERILYERFLALIKQRQVATQRQLHPRTLQLAPADVPLMEELLPELNAAGFDVQPFGQNSFVVHGVPAELEASAADDAFFEQLIEQYKHEAGLQSGIQERTALLLARRGAKKRGQSLSHEEMQSIIDQLFACELPQRSPSGRHCYLQFSLEDLQKKFSP